MTDFHFQGLVKLKVQNTKISHFRLRYVSEVAMRTQLKAVRLAEIKSRLLDSMNVLYLPVFIFIYSIEILLIILLALKIGKYISWTSAGFKVYFPVYLGKRVIVNS